MYTTLKKVNEGFTIVETLIVLAIAALIITIILIAVPDLQRSGRNSNMLHDAQNIASSIQNYESNNEGALPLAGGAGDTGNKAAGSGDQVTIAGGASTAAATATVQASDAVNFEEWSVNTGITWAGLGTSSLDSGDILVVFQADCSTTSGQATGSSGSLTPANDARAVAVYYPIETSGTGNIGCIQE